MFSVLSCCVYSARYTSGVPTAPLVLKLIFCGCLAHACFQYTIKRTVFPILSRWIIVPLLQEDKNIFFKRNYPTDASFIA
jgi:hypothetical protein